MKLNSIQMLRAIAALLVLFYHVRGVQTRMLADAGLDASGRWAPLVDNGFAGVDLFFVISGFVMVFVTAQGARGPMAATSFLFARAVRIYPLWWLFAGIFTLYMLTAHAWLDLFGLGWDAIGAGEPPAEYLAKSFALVPQAQYPVLNVGWTLIHEMYFYLVFTVFLLLPHRWLPALLAGWAVLVFAGGLAGFAAPIAGTLLTLAAHPMTLEFILGAVTALLVLSGRRWRPGIASIIGAIWLGVALWFVLPPEFTPSPDAPPLFAGLVWTDGQIALVGTENWSAYTLSWGRVIAYAVPCALLVYGLACLEIEGRLPVSRMLVRLGDWSYALYLSHILVLAGLAIILPDVLAMAERLFSVPQSVTELFQPINPGLDGNIGFSILACTASIVTAGLAYNFFERPVMAWFGAARRKLFSGPRATLAPGVLRARIW